MDVGGRQRREQAVERSDAAISVRESSAQKLRVFLDIDVVACSYLQRLAGVGTSINL